MKKLYNPFVKLDGYQCFGCSPDNEHGLQLKFVEEDDYVTAVWEPKEHFQGWLNTLHGGIQATLLDEIASWLVFVKLDTSGVTCEMDFKLRHPVKVNEGNIHLKARLLEMKRNIAVIEAHLFNSKMELCTEGIIKYFTFSQEVAKHRFWYPGKAEFYKPQIKTLK